MRNRIILFVVVLLIPIVLAEDFALLNIETSFTDPYPVEPGKNLVLSLSLSNNGNSAAKDITIELQPSEPFTLLESSVEKINELQPGKTKIIEYNLFIGSSAVSAVYQIPLKINYDKTFNLTKNVNVRVQGIPDFKLISVKSDEFNSGKNQEITVVVQNLGSGKAKRTLATFKSSSTEISPVLSGGIVYMGDVDVGQTKLIKFNLHADSEAEYGVYPGYVNITYEDESGNALSDKFDIGILISGKPYMNVLKTEVDIEEQRLTVEVNNLGTADADAIRGELVIDNKTFDVDYITRIKTDKSASFKFKIPQTETGILKLSYKGPDSTEYTKEEIIAWDRPKTNGVNWIIIVVVVIVVYIVWKLGIIKKVLRLNKAKTDKK